MSISISIKQSSNFSYELIFDNYSYNNEFLQPLLESILELIPNSSIVCYETESKYSIHFYANKVIYLNQKREKEENELNELNNKKLLNYHETLIMMHDLNKQNDFLINQYSCGFFCIDLNNILVIDSSIFICIQPKFIRKIHLNNLVFQYPFSRSNSTSFFSPEIINLNTIPATVCFKCFYYSLGSFCIYCLFGIKIPCSDFTVHDVDIEKILKPIYQTKLYWTILKAIDFDVQKRTLLYC
jgi:hypothetical protein